MLANIAQEAKTGVVVIEEFPADVVRQMVAFLYDGKYKTVVEEAGDSTDQEVPDPRHLFHLRMNAIADYYNIESLRAASRDSLHLALAQTKDGREIPELVAAARESNGDKKLHGVLGTAAIRHLPQLINNGTLADHCTDDFEYQLIVACSEKIEKLTEKIKVQRHWENKVPEGLRCFLKKISTRNASVRCEACDRTYHCADEEFTLKWTSEDSEDDEADGSGRSELVVVCKHCDVPLA